MRTKPLYSRISFENNFLDFTMAFKIIFTTYLLMASCLVFAKGGMDGGGGSYDQADLFGEQESYTQIVSKIRKFFGQNEQELKRISPKIKLDKLLDVSKNLRIDIVDRELVDDDGVKGRTCLNYRGYRLIRCDIKKLRIISNNPKAQFVLIFHELLGLMGLEETSPLNPQKIDGYKISKKIAPYVTKVAEYDLVTPTSALSNAALMNGSWKLSTVKCSNGTPINPEILSIIKKELSAKTYFIQIKGRTFLRNFENECISEKQKFVISSKIYGATYAAFVETLKEDLKNGCQIQQQPQSLPVIKIAKNTSKTLEIIDPGLDMLPFYCPSGSDAIVVLRRK